MYQLLIFFLSHTHFFQYAINFTLFHIYPHYFYHNMLKVKVTIKHFMNFYTNKSYSFNNKNSHKIRLSEFLFVFYMCFSSFFKIPINNNAKPTINNIGNSIIITPAAAKPSPTYIP